MIKVHIMVGVSASGKTTISKTIAKKEKAIRLSSDEIRLDLINKGVLDKESAFTPDGHAVVFRIMYYLQAKQLVRKGNDILLDAQQIRLSDRQGIFNALKEFDCYFIAHVMMTDKAECERRYKKRDMGEDNFYPFQVPQRKTMDDRFKMFVMPTKEEGFDEIRYITEEEQNQNFQKACSPSLRGAERRSNPTGA